MGTPPAIDAGSPPMADPPLGTAWRPPILWFSRRGGCPTSGPRRLLCVRLMPMNRPSAWGPAHRRGHVVDQYSIKVEGIGIGVASAGISRVASSCSTPRRWSVRRIGWWHTRIEFAALLWYRLGIHFHWRAAITF